MKRQRCMMGLWATLVIAPSVGLAKLSRTEDSVASFRATGPGGLTIEGKTAEVSLDESASDVVVSVVLAKLDTGIELRNKHMCKKYLETDKYPKAELRVARSSLRIPSDGADTDASVQATMTLHGQNHPIAIHYTAHRDGSKYVVR